MARHKYIIHRPSRRSDGNIIPGVRHTVTEVDGFTTLDAAARAAQEALEQYPADHFYSTDKGSNRSSTWGELFDYLDSQKFDTVEYLNFSRAGRAVLMETSIIVVDLLSVGAYWETGINEAYIATVFFRRRGNFPRTIIQAKFWDWREAERFVNVAQRYIHLHVVEDLPLTEAMEELL